MDEKKKTNEMMEQADLKTGEVIFGELPPAPLFELEDRVFIPRSRYDELLQAETKLNIIIDNVKDHPDSYKYDNVIKAVLREDVKENAE